VEDYSDLMKPWFAEAAERGESFSPPPSDAVGVSRRARELGQLYRDAMLALQEDLLGYIHAQPPGFFEQLVIDVVLALGYAGRRRDLARKIGRAGDGGVDAVIALDELGLDAIYLQAKRLRPGTSVSAPQVRDFLGSLEKHHATKGVFVTTGEFTAAARAATENLAKRVVLINGKDLTELMVRHCIGVRLVETFQFKEVDVSYFQGRAGASNTSASTQPRK
jgi:restriction system protein